jgi:phosphate starvation-inducible protein PhoH and related proteins
LSKAKTTTPPENPVTPVISFPRRNEGQKLAAKLFYGDPKKGIKPKDIIFLLGPAGTGKTHAAVSLAMQAEWVVITRPAKELEDESLGYLKGGLEEKLHPYMLPILDVLRTQLGKAEAEKKFLTFDVCPLAFVRGRTFSNCVAILDEAQNATRNQRKTYLTRLGKGGKMIISGDPTQSDINGGKAFIEEVTALEKAGVAGVVWFDQSMQERSPLLADIEGVYTRLGAS